MRSSRILSLFALFLLSGCGYHFRSDSLVSNYRTISIPYVEGDDKGLLTNALVHDFSTEGQLLVANGCGDLLLKVCLEAPFEDNLGYRYAHDEDGNLRKVITAEEARLTIVATVSVIDRRMGCVLLGPTEIDAFMTFDFEPDFSTVDFHKFSLGQLEMHTLASDNAFRPLYEQLAQKIVDYVVHSW